MAIDFDALRFIAEPHEWLMDGDGDMYLPECDDDPGWLVWCSGERLRLSWGCIDFECDTQGDIARAARRLLAAAKGWESV